MGRTKKDAPRPDECQCPDPDLSAPWPPNECQRCKRAVIKIVAAVLLVLGLGMGLLPTSAQGAVQPALPHYTPIAGNAGTVSVLACQRRVTSPYGDLWEVRWRGVNALPTTNSATLQVFRNGSLVSQASVILASFRTIQGPTLYASVLLHDKVRGVVRYASLVITGPLTDPSTLGYCP